MQLQLQSVSVCKQVLEMSIICLLCKLARLVTLIPMVLGEANIKQDGMELENKEKDFTKTQEFQVYLAFQTRMIDII